MADRISLGDVAAVRWALNKLRGADIIARVEAAEALLGPTRVEAPLMIGGRMHVDLHDVVGREIYAWGAFEPELTEFFYRYLPAEATFIDVGAHFGYFSKIALEALGPEGRVIAVEPMAWTLEVLHENLGPDPRARIIEKAAWSSLGELALIWYGERAAAYASIAQMRADAKDTRPAESVVVVETTSLDTLSETVSGSVFIKIDAETAEFEILRGALAFIAVHRPIITIEIGDFPGLSQLGATTTSEVLHLIEGQNYGLFDYAASALHPHNLRDRGAYGYWNIVCVPRELTPLMPQRALPDVARPAP